MKKLRGPHLHLLTKLTRLSSRALLSAIHSPSRENSQERTTTPAAGAVRVREAFCPREYCHEALSRLPQPRRPQPQEGLGPEAEGPPPGTPGAGRPHRA